MGKMSQPGSNRPESRGGFWGRLPAWLGKRWWAGLGVILAAAGTVVGLILSSGAAPTYSNHGDCTAQGSGNTVICSGANTKPGR